MAWDKPQSLVVGFKQKPAEKAEVNEIRKQMWQSVAGWRVEGGWRDEAHNTCRCIGTKDF